jgi:hypothetical protein
VLVEGLWGAISDAEVVSRRCSLSARLSPDQVCGPRCEPRSRTLNARQVLNAQVAPPSPMAYGKSGIDPLITLFLFVLLGFPLCGLQGGRHLRAMLSSCQKLDFRFPDRAEE